MIRRLLVLFDVLLAAGALALVLAWTLLIHGTVRRLAANHHFSEATMTRRSVYWTTREPYRNCKECNAPFGLHIGSCSRLVAANKRIARSKAVKEFIEKRQRGTGA